MRQSRWLRILTVMGCGQLGACAFLANHELKITDVGSPKIIKPSDLSDGWAKPGWSSHSAQAAIGFSTNPDLWNFAQSARYNVGIQVSACADQKLNPEQELQSSVYVYTKSEAVNSLSNKPPLDMGQYWIYFSIARFPTRSDTPQTFRYDLAADPFDVCFRLHGGRMFAGTFYSNTVVIPGTVIGKALAEIGP